MNPYILVGGWCHISCPHMETGSFEGVIRFFLNKNTGDFCLDLLGVMHLLQLGLLVELSNHVELKIA